MGERKIDLLTIRVRDFILREWESCGSVWGLVLRLGNMVFFMEMYLKRNKWQSEGYDPEGIPSLNFSIYKMELLLPACRYMSQCMQSVKQGAYNSVSLQ